MKKGAAALVAQAASLSADEFNDLITKLQALKAISGSASVTAQEKDSALGMYEAIAEAVRQANGTRLMPFHVFKKTRNYVAFAQAAQLAEEFILTLERDRVRKVAVRLWLCKLLVAHILDRGRPLEFYVISSEMVELPAILDNYFPGYRASGLMHVVLASLYKGTKKPQLKRR